MMGKEGNNLDTFVAQLNHDMAACKMEMFKWTDFSVLIFINTLRSSDKNEEKLAECLNQLYNAERQEKTLEIATMQAEVRSFWRNIKENHKMTWGKNGKEGGNGNQGDGNQGNQGGKDGKGKKGK